MLVPSAFLLRPPFACNILCNFLQVCPSLIFLHPLSYPAAHATTNTIPRAFSTSFLLLHYRMCFFLLLSALHHHPSCKYLGYCCRCRVCLVRAARRPIFSQTPSHQINPNIYTVTNYFLRISHSCLLIPVQVRRSYTPVIILNGRADLRFKNTELRTKSVFSGGSQDTCMLIMGIFCFRNFDKPGILSWIVVVLRESGIRMWTTKIERLNMQIGALTWKGKAARPDCNPPWPPNSVSTCITIM